MSSYFYVYFYTMVPSCVGARRGRDRTVVGFITTYAISVYHYYSNPAQARCTRYKFM